jgi:hypothetical protein
MGLVAKALSSKFNPNMREAPRFVKEGAVSLERGESLADGPALCVRCHSPIDVTKSGELVGPASSGEKEAWPDPTPPTESSRRTSRLIRRRA